MFTVLLAEEYAYLLNESGGFTARRLITAVLLSVVFSCTVQFTLRLATSFVLCCLALIDYDVQTFYVSWKLTTEN